MSFPPCILPCMPRKACRAGSRYVPPRAVPGKNSGSRLVWWQWRIPRRPHRRTRYIPYHCCRTAARACLPAWQPVLLHRAGCSPYVVRRWYRLGRVFRRPEQGANRHSHASSPLPTILPSHRYKHVPIPVPSRKRDSPSRTSHVRHDRNTGPSGSSWKGMSIRRA